MYKVRAWFELRESPEDDEQDSMEIAVAEAKAAADRVTHPGARIAIDWLNGDACVSLTLSTNRATPSDGINEFIEFIRVRFPGAFGVVYEGDDERTEAPGPNAFKVRVLARGVITVRDDPFLSPRNPVFED